MIFYRRFQPPAAITFDLDDTLYDNLPIIKRAEQVLRDHLVEHHPEVFALIAAQWQSVRQACIAQDPRLGSDMSQLRLQILQRLAEQAGYSKAEQESVADTGYRLFYEARSAFSVNKTIDSLLFELSQRCPLIAITNGNVNLQQVGIAQYFQANFQASLDYPAKPHAAMFNAALDHLAIQPDKILHVGDHLIKDVLGAHQCGMQTAWFAVNRPMRLGHEEVAVLPTVELQQLSELLTLTE
ncbi:HAD-IA family hydrolase [Alteromonas oceanisediminis]|uniref:HAD-IA family hydrolase n=1 Tax=Alteromonas oceanisediminis TaxID=2836180 RepID=UPI001BD98504|nr:HAD-IA family hydrolase [Alteromonas oceanisediminis]MBT0586843.1 HAD-IA family hydrolase [Alteromonas oceanisediminis]